MCDRPDDPTQHDFDQRAADADAIVAGRVFADHGIEPRSIEGRTDDFGEVMAQLEHEAASALKACIANGNELDLREFFGMAFMVGVATAQAEGLTYAEWLLSQIAQVNLGVARGAARRVAAGHMAVHS